MDDRTLSISRLIHATPLAVWRAWTDPDILPRWFGPQGYVCKTKEINLSPGGVWRFDMIGPDGKVWANRHRILLHEPPHRLEFLLDDDSDAPAAKVTVVLTPEGQGTLLQQTMLFPNIEMKQGAEAFGAVELGQTTLAKLAAMVED